MWQRFFCYVGSILLFVGCGSAEKAAFQAPIRCSILSFESRSGMKPGEAESVTEIFSSALHKTGRFTIVERNQLNAVLREQGFQATQTGEDAVRAGKILSVRKMFLGSIGMLGNNYLVNLKMIDVETSQIDYAQTWTFDDDLEYIGEDFFPKIVQEFVKKIDAAEKK
jgi:curli biogenesis system outer membrane secretion channel CsgG